MAKGFNWNKVTLHKIGTPEVTKRNYENIQKLKAKPPTATAAPTARGFTTSKRKTKSSRKTCSTCKRKK